MEGVSRYIKNIFVDIDILSNHVEPKESKELRSNSLGLRILGGVTLVTAASLFLTGISLPPVGAVLFIITAIFLAVLGNDFITMGNNLREAISIFNPINFDHGLWQAGKQFCGNAYKTGQTFFEEAITQVPAEIKGTILFEPIYLAHKNAHAKKYNY